MKTMNNATSIQKRPPGPQELLKHDLERASSSLAAMLPKHVTVERLVKVVLSATARNSKLLECSRPSIIRAVMQSAELGLEIGGLLGEAYLVPFKRSWKDDDGKWHSEMEATCIPGYKGYIKLARNSGQILSIGARVVYARDRFTVDLASEHIEHQPDMSDDPGELVFVYAIARFREGGQQIEIMRRAQIEAIRKRSKTYNAGSKPWADGTKPGESSGPWAIDYDEMARKTVVRRLAKYLPLSPELQKAIELDAQHDDAERRASDAGVVIDAHFVPDKPRGAALVEAVAADGTIHDARTGEVRQEPRPDPLSEEDPPLTETRQPGED
jgi:recombination protein RecT